MVFLRDVVVSSSASPLEVCLDWFFAASAVIVFLLPRPDALKTSGLSTGRLEQRMATLSSVSVQRAAETLFHVGSAAIDAARRVGRRIIETMQTLLGELDIAVRSGSARFLATYKNPRPKIANSTILCRGAMGSFHMLGIGSRKIAKSVVRPIADVNSQIGRVLRHHDAVLGWIVARGMQVIVRRTP